MREGGCMSVRVGHNPRLPEERERERERRAGGTKLLVTVGRGKSEQS